MIGGGLLLFCFFKRLDTFMSFALAFYHDHYLNEHYRLEIPVPQEIRNL